MHRFYHKTSELMNIRFHRTFGTLPRFCTATQKRAYSRARAIKTRIETSPDTYTINMHSILEGISMVNEIIDFEPFTLNDRDAVLDMIKTTHISENYKSGLVNTANWMFDDIVYLEINTIDSAKKALREAEQRLMDARVGASEEDLKKAEFLEQTMLNRLKHRLVRTIEGACPDCIDW